MADLNKKSKTDGNMHKITKNAPMSRGRTSAGTSNVGTRMNIKEQTVSQRRNAKEAKKINPDAPEIKRSAKRAQGYKIKKKKKKISRETVLFGMMFSLIFIVIATVFCLSFYGNLVKVDSVDYGNLKLKMGLSYELNEIKGQKINPDEYMRGGEMYVNMTAMAEKFGFVITGTSDCLRFITDLKTGENVRVYVDTPFVEINGTKVRLNSKITQNGDSIFIPAEFFAEYVSGIEIAYDEEKSVISVLRSTEINENGHLAEQNITFTLKAIKESVSLPEENLTDEEKAKTFFPSLSTPAN